MKRREIVQALSLTAAGRGPTLSAQEAPPRIRPLAQDHVVVYESPDPARVFAYSPGLVRLDSGRLAATLDRSRTDRPGLILTSDDRGRTWTARAETPMRHARPFVAGGSLYVLGHAGDLMVARSDDGGATWTEPVKLTSGQSWSQSASNVVYSRGRVYLVMERITDTRFPGWQVAVMAPVLMSADVGGDLTKREAWVFSDELAFRELLEKAGRPRLIGAPFFKPGPTVAGAPRGFRHMHPMGWLEMQVVQFTDPDHVWFDPDRRTFHLWARAHTGLTNYACVLKAVEAQDRRRIAISLESAPSGEPALYVPCPGGHMRFHILWDGVTGLYWLLSSQSTDSMTRPDRLPPERFGLPDNERSRLALHFSRNCVDWCFGCLVAVGATPKQARHYASMAIDGEDLQVLSRSGDHRAASAHDGNLITLHTVRRFRELVY
ncbi:MAG: exo-alpha-sialidase [Bryobacterales bacterium]|nr:exo-alpha-sialidase [Bryobacterales bacterium]